MKTLKVLAISLISLGAISTAKAQVSGSLNVNFGSPGYLPVYDAPVVVERPIVYTEPEVVVVNRPVYYRPRPVVVHSRPVYYSRPVVYRTRNVVYHRAPVYRTRTVVYDRPGRFHGPKHFGRPHGKHHGYERGYIHKGSRYRH